MTDLQKKWLEALRGQSETKYRQGKKMLRTPANSFCCLGVLADVIGLKWVMLDGGEWEVEPGTRESWGSFGYPGVYLPNEILNKVGLTQVDGEHLAYLNDTGVSFNEIADKLQKHFEENNNDGTTTKVD